MMWMIAAWLVMYFVWTYIHCAQAISYALDSGQVSMRDNLYDIVSFYMESCASYLVYAILLVAAGSLLWRGNVGDGYVYSEDGYGDDLDDDESSDTEAITPDGDESSEGTTPDDDAVSD